MSILRAKAIEARAQRGDITMKDIKGGIKHFRNNRSLGGDFWAPLEVKALEEEHVEGLKDIMNEAESKMVAPAQALLSIIPLLSKPQGGDRPVVLAALFYVIWSGVRNPDISPWEAGFVAFWDAAVKGSKPYKRR